jgi:hypothetical protein
MMHSRKMLLVPAQESYVRQMIPPAVSHLANLDAEMSKILNSNTEPADVKLKNYNQLLRRYMKLQNEQFGAEEEEMQPEAQRPVQQQHRTVASSVGRSRDQIDPGDVTPIPSTLPFSDDSILEGMPAKNMKNARRLLHYLKINPNLSWNRNGEMIFKGERQPQSNIVDLVHDFSRYRVSVTPPSGHLTLAKALRDQNVPRESIGNPARWKMIEDAGLATLPFEIAHRSFSRIQPNSTPVQYLGTPNTSSRNTSRDTSHELWFEAPNTTTRK